MSDAALDRAHEVADELFERHTTVFGADLPVYRGHVHRVIGLVGGQRPVEPPVAGVLGLAAFFHDAAIWFDGTWDYLEPSAERAVAGLPEAERPYTGLVRALITEHHRIRRAHHDDPLVEAFRRADLTDVTAGLIGCPGVPRADYKAATTKYPARGFRPLLLGAFRRGLREAPLRPAPMLKF